MSLLGELTEEWRLRAACRDIGPEMFFLDSRIGRRNEENYSKAREICARCPVRVECLNYALRCEPVVQGHRLGFWGGMMPAERRRIAAKLGRLVVCSECGAPFTTRTSNAKVCSPGCRRSRLNRLDREHRAEQAMAS